MEPAVYPLISRYCLLQMIKNVLAPISRRWIEAVASINVAGKPTYHLNDLVSRELKAGLTARYLLMDSWFTMPATVTSLAGLIPVIGMVK